eukprot:4240415-Lingulodinium_polyedra.AAC.1
MGVPASSAVEPTQITIDRIEVMRGMLRRICCLTSPTSHMSLTRTFSLSRSGRFERAALSQITGSRSECS